MEPQLASYFLNVPVSVPSLGSTVAPDIRRLVGEELRTIAKKRAKVRAREGTCVEEDEYDGQTHFALIADKNEAKKALLGFGLGVALVGVWYWARGSD